MSVTNDIQNSILKAIDTMAQRRIDQLKLDKTITAIINSPVGVTNGRKIYKVEYEGGYFNATAQNKDDAYLPRMAVYVQVPQGDFSKEKFILGQASKLATDEQVSVISAIQNRFNIIGKNVVNNQTEKMGVYSYHNPIEEENNPDKIKHRFNFLYNSNQTENQITINNENLNLYKKNATALMVRAEFMTKLTNEQKKKATGEYGLVFNLVFNNLAAGLGETQEQVFKYFQDKIQVDKIVDGETQKLSLNIINTKLIEALDTKTYEQLTDTDQYLDEIISDIQELDRVYKNNNPAEYTFAVQDLLSKYLILVQDIKRAATISDMKRLYQSWMDEVIGQPAEKQVSYYLSSNDMIGNPFSFSSWISQYNIFEIDLENFLRIDSILLYKQGFIQDEVKEVVWSDGEPDILVKDIQVYAMQPLTDNNAGYQLKVESQDTGLIFNGDEPEDFNIIANATLLRQYFEDLTRNSDTTFYWFKQSENIVSPMQSEYSIYGGIGWSEINNQNSAKLKISKKDAPAYENHFRCTAVYMGEEVPIVLQYDFIVYNYAGQKFILQSDLGTDFTFDAGIPTITVYKQEGDNLITLHKDYEKQQYKFKWAIVDGNNQKTFLDTKSELNLTDITISNFNDYTNTSKLLKDIKWYHGDTEVTTETEKAYATKIQYPMSNIANSASITFECYISYRQENEITFYPLGKTELTLNNFKILNANSYRIWIENGDQVFQYDEYGNAPNVDKYKDPIEVLPLKVHLFAPNNIEVQNSSFRTRWYFPTEETLIIYDRSNAEVDPETQYTNMFRGSEVIFNIEKMYNYNFTNNQIRCQIDFNDRTLYAETDFIFTKVGNNGTNGTDIVAKIDVKEDKWKNILFSQPFTLYVDKAKNEVFSNIDTTVNNEFVLTDYLESKIYQKSQEITDTDRIQTRWNIAGNTSTAMIKKGKNIDIEDNGLVWRNVDESAKKIYHQYILKSETTYREKTQNENANNKKTYYAFYSLPVIFYENHIPTQESVRIAIDRDTYLKEVIYNADGRNPLYNQNQGLKLINLPDNCSIIWEACGGYTENEDSPSFLLLLDKDDRKYPEQKIEDSLQNQIYILPNDEFSGAITNNYIKAIIVKNNETIATVIAPINMSLNTFGLASMNAWDGNSIATDEEAGTIYAPQIGAGYKDSKTNLFTGVVMGQADDYSSGQEHLYTGLMGYKDGMRSFFLDSETGNAIFGYPTLATDSDKVRKYKDGEWTEIDNYSEGEIKLIPGGESVIGGWRLGRKSLYYTDTKKLGDKYSIDYVPDTAGLIREKDMYNAHHLKDIKHDDSGILLYSGEYPYLSIKGKKLTVNEINSSLNSNLLPGDSLEVQLDPITPTLFTIFRHNGEARINGTSTMKPNSRTFLAGINSKGELVANAIGAVAGGNGAENSGTATKSTVNLLKAFTDTQNSEPSYIGALFEAGNYTIGQLFIDKNITSNGTLYITGGQNVAGDEYRRPISIHGRSISLYSSNNSDTDNQKTTDQFIKIDSSINNGQFLLQTDKDKNKIEFNDNSESYIYTKNTLNINTNSSDFNLTTGIQSITASGSITVGSSGYTLNSSGAISINTAIDNDIKINRYEGSHLILEKNIVQLRANQNDNNSNYYDDNNSLYINATTDVSNSKPNHLKTKYPLQIASTSGRLQLKGNIKNSAGGLTDESADVIINAGASTTIRFKSYWTAGESYPMDLDFGNAGLLQVHFPNNTNTNPQQITSAYSTFYISMNEEIANGLKINGNYKAGTYGLDVARQTHFGDNVTVANSKIISVQTASGVRFREIDIEKNGSSNQFFDSISTTNNGVNYIAANLLRNDNTLNNKINDLSTKLTNLINAYNSHTHYINATTKTATKTNSTSYTKFTGGVVATASESKYTSPKDSDQVSSSDIGTREFYDNGVYNGSMDEGLGSLRVNVPTENDTISVTATATATLDGQYTNGPNTTVS